MSVRIKNNVNVSENKEQRTIRQADGSDNVVAANSVVLDDGAGNVVALPAAAYRTLFEEVDDKDSQEDPKDAA